MLAVLHNWMLGGHELIAPREQRENQRFVPGGWQGARGGDSAVHTGGFHFARSRPEVDDGGQLQRYRTTMSSAWREPFSDMLIRVDFGNPGIWSADGI